MYEMPSNLFDRASQVMKAAYRQWRAREELATLLRRLVSFQAANSFIMIERDAR